MQQSVDRLPAVLTFLEDHRLLWDSSVLEFFTERLWEKLPCEWLHALAASPLDDLLRLPSGHVRDWWPLSLKDFVHTAHTVSLPREPALSTSPPLASIKNGLDHVVAQGMSPKKRHEVAALAGLVAEVAKQVGAKTIIDVGAGQGYLSNVLYYQFGLQVIAVDAALGHAGVMQKRNHSLSKYFRNLRLKAEQAAHPRQDCTKDSCQDGCNPNGATLYMITDSDASERARSPVEETRLKTDKAERRCKTDSSLPDGPIAITSHIDMDDAASFLVKLRAALSHIGTNSTGVLKAKSHRRSSLQEKNGNHLQTREVDSKDLNVERDQASTHSDALLGEEGPAGRLLDGPVVLAGLHACGDLSASMLRTFRECPGVAAVVVVSCCYNLVTETLSGDSASQPHSSTRDGLDSERSEASVEDPESPSLENVCIAQQSLEPKQRQGFPLSVAVKASGFKGLGINGRMLACQSAARWQDQGEGGFREVITKHTLRAAFQSLLAKHFPTVWAAKPVLGKQKKQRVEHPPKMDAVEGSEQDRSAVCYCENRSRVGQEPSDVAAHSTARSMNPSKVVDTKGAASAATSDAQWSYPAGHLATISRKPRTETTETSKEAHVSDSNSRSDGQSKQTADERQRFFAFAKQFLDQLGLPQLSEEQLLGIWEDIAPVKEMVGPFWTLRTAMAGPLESLLLLDRLLYVEERTEEALQPVCEKRSQTGIASDRGRSVRIFPLFNPRVSPRNMVIVGQVLVDNC